MFNGHFDGKHIVLDEPAALKLNAKVKVITADAGEMDSDIAQDCAGLSEAVFEKIWDNSLDADYDRL
jgi:hypothetical protein